MRRMYSQKQLEKVVDNVIDEKDIAPVSGTSDGTNWTALTIGDETHGFDAGGGDKIVYVDSSTTAQELAAILNDNLIPVYRTTSSGKTWCLPLVYVDDSFYNFGAIQNDRWYYNRFSITTDRWEGIYNHMAIPLNSLPSNTEGTYMLECSVNEYGSHNYYWTDTPTIPDAVSGTNDGTNWTSITIGDTTKNIPSGGSGSGFTYKEIVVRDWNVSGDITSQFTQSQLADMYRNPENYIVRVRKDTTNIAHYAYLEYNNHVGELIPATQKYVWWDTNYEIATQASPPKLWNHGKFEIGYKSEEGVFSYYAYFYARIEYTLS